MAFRCFNEELAQTPRLVGDRLPDRHLASNVLLVQVIDALAIDIGEPRMIAGVPRRHLTSAITDHEPKISELQKGPAANALVLGETELLGEIGDRSFEIIDGQYMLRFRNLEPHDGTSVRSRSNTGTAAIRAAKTARTISGNKSSRMRQ